MGGAVFSRFGILVVWEVLAFLFSMRRLESHEKRVLHPLRPQYVGRWSLPCAPGLHYWRPLIFWLMGRDSFEPASVQVVISCATFRICTQHVTRSTPFTRSQTTSQPRVVHTIQSRWMISRTKWVFRSTLYTPHREKGFHPLTLTSNKRQQANSAMYNPDTRNPINQKALHPTHMVAAKKHKSKAPSDPKQEVSVSTAADA